MYRHIYTDAVILMLSWEFFEDITNDVVHCTAVNMESSWMLRKLVSFSGTLHILGLKYTSFLGYSIYQICWIYSVLTI